MAENAVISEIIQPANVVAVPADVAGWKMRIAASWRAAAESILRVSKDLHDARNNLSQRDRSLWLTLSKELHEEKLISDSIQKKLLVIGARYSDFEGMAALLPPRYNAIYQLTDLTKPQLDRLAKSSQLAPTLEDREIATLIDQRAGHSPQGNATKETAIPILRLTQTKKRIPAETKKALVRLMQRLRKLDGFHLILTAEGAKISGED